MLKIILLVLGLLGMLWLLRSAARRPETPANTNPAPTPPTAMLRCAHCGTHLPRDEALPGRGGVFCDAAHRQAFEAAHPKS